MGQMEKREGDASLFGALLLVGVQEQMQALFIRAQHLHRAGQRIAQLCFPARFLH